MATTQTYAGLSQEQKTFYDRTLLDRLLPTLIYTQYGQKKQAPKREGDTMNFRRFNSLAAATTPLTEGVTPTGNTLSISSVTATVSQYGDYVQISDKIDMVGIDPVLTEAVQVLGEQAGLTVDTVVRDIVVAGTSVQYAGGVAGRSSVASTNLLTGTEIKKAVRTLRRNNAKEVADGAFIGIIGPDAEFDLMSDSMWVDVSKYQNAEQVYKGEIGKLYGVKFIRTSNTKKFAGAGASGIDVFATMIIAKDFYGVCDIAGSSKPESIVKGFGSAGTSDPLDQISTAGWKALFTAVRLQELAAVRIEHACTP